MSGRPSGRMERGFTLIEVLAALVILALSLGALLRLVSGGLGGLGAAEDYTTASLLAESWLEGLGVERALLEGEETGAFDERFRWRAVVRSLALDERGEPSDWPVRAYEVQLTVLWDEGIGQRSIVLSTLRLAPDP
jgi:general secretion pathway protein I